jgi:hypothetical protein
MAQREDIEESNKSSSDKKINLIDDRLGASNNSLRKS